MAIDPQMMDRFTPQAEAAMMAAGASDGDMAIWRRELPEDQVQLWRITGEADGYLLTRVETMPEGHDELVLLAAAGTNARPVIAWVKTLARRAGISSIRTHVKRLGLQRMYEAQGWHLAERVMRISTNG